MKHLAAKHCAINKWALSLMQSLHSQKVDVSTVVKVHTFVSWILVPCSLVGGYHCFGGTH